MSSRPTKYGKERKERDKSPPRSTAAKDTQSAPSKPKTSTPKPSASKNAPTSKSAASTSTAKPSASTSNPSASKSKVSTSKPKSLPVSESSTAAVSASSPKPNTGSSPDNDHIHKPKIRNKLATGSGEFAALELSDHQLDRLLKVVEETKNKKTNRRDWNAVMTILNAEWGTQHSASSIMSTCNVHEAAMKREGKGTGLKRFSEEEDNEIVALVAWCGYLSWPEITEYLRQFMEMPHARGENSLASRWRNTLLPDLLEDENKHLVDAIRLRESVWATMSTWKGSKVKLEATRKSDKPVQVFSKDMPKMFQQVMKDHEQARIDWDIEMRARQMDTQSYRLVQENWSREEAMKIVEKAGWNWCKHGEKPDELARYVDEVASSMRAELGSAAAAPSSRQVPDQASSMTYLAEVAQRMSISPPSDRIRRGRSRSRSRSREQTSPKAKAPMTTASSSRQESDTGGLAKALPRRITIDDLLDDGDKVKHKAVSKASGSGGGSESATSRSGRGEKRSHGSPAPEENRRKPRTDRGDERKPKSDKGDEKKKRKSTTNTAG